MLVSFSVSNFRSFGDEMTLEMVASNKLEDHPDHLVPIADTDKYLVRAPLSTARMRLASRTLCRQSLLPSD